jgi:hypothetical protein
MVTRRLASVLATLSCACACAAGVLAQDRPDFSGTWKADPVRSARTGADGKSRTALMLGMECTIKQNANAITLEITAAGPLRVTAVYKLDGSESKNRVPDGPGLPDVEIVSRASWEGSKLVIRSTSAAVTGGKAIQIESVRTLFIDSDGTLVLERTGTPVSEVPETRSVYKKKS